MFFLRLFDFRLKLYLATYKSQAHPFPPPFLPFPPPPTEASKFSLPAPWILPDNLASFFCSTMDRVMCIFTRFPFKHTHTTHTYQYDSCRLSLVPETTSRSTSASAGAERLGKVFGRMEGVIDNASCSLVGVRIQSATCTDGLRQDFPGLFHLSALVTDGSLPSCSLKRRPRLLLFRIRPFALPCHFIHTDTKPIQQVYKQHERHSRHSNRVGSRTAHLRIYRPGNFGGPRNDRESFLLLRATPQKTETR